MNNNKSTQVPALALAPSFSPEESLLELSGDSPVNVLFVMQSPCRYRFLEDLEKAKADQEIRSVKRLVHQDRQRLLTTLAEPGAAESIDTVVIEGRIFEAFEDLELVESIRLARPFLPIILVSANNSLDYKLAAYRAGLTDYLSHEVSGEEFVEKIKVLHKIARSGRLIEVQNDQLLASLGSLHEANRRLREEIEAKNLAELERKNSQARLFASEKMASLGEMAGGIAHEINNPLAIIFGRIDELQDRLKQPQPDIAGAIAGASRILFIAQRIASVIKGLSAFSRNGDKDPFVAVDPLGLIASTLTLCSERYKQNGVKLILDLPETASPISARGVHLSQVLVNLLNNAFDSVKGQEQAWIKLSLQQTPESTYLSVADSGDGVPEAIRLKVWEPFFTTKEVGKGTGLGLSISKGIIEDHGGSLTMEEVDQKYARFEITLPNQQVNGVKG